MGEDDADGVTGTGRDDRVDADAGEVRAVDRDPRDAVLRVGGSEDIAPRSARARELQEVAADRERERQEVNRPELVEERIDSVEYADGHVRRYALAFAV